MEAKPLARIKELDVIHFLMKNIVFRFGVPRIIITDNGTQFTGESWKNALEELEIQHLKASVAYQQANGQVEITNKAVLQGLKKRLMDANRNWVLEHLEVHSLEVWNFEGNIDENLRVGLKYLPVAFKILIRKGSRVIVSGLKLFLCVCVGLWAGLIIGFVTEYYTSNAYRTRAATNVIFGLALGYKSVIIPIFAIAVSIFVSFSFDAMYGIVVAALGMLSTIATGLAIDAYGPISDNAGGIAEMAGMSHKIRERTDALDAAGNTTAAIGKKFNYRHSHMPLPRGLNPGSAALVSLALVTLALFGAYVSRASIITVDVLTPKVFIGLLVSAMLPYWFSAMTMKSVGSAALKMVEEVRRQFNTIPGLMEGTAKPDYATCVKISTDASLKEMISPGALVMLTPLIVGILFGVETLSGVLAGSLVSGVQIAISASNTGGAWDNAKKYIEAGASEHARTLGPKGSDPHKAAVIAVPMCASMDEQLLDAMCEGDPVDEMLFVMRGKILTMTTNV
ncbi:hypothetical protein AgCh_032996 [Apium graveolens]